MSANSPFSGNEQSHLSREIHILKIFVGFLAIAVVGLILKAVFPKAIPKQTELTVQRINIVDASGKSRLVISNKDQFPPPIVGGEIFKRAISPAGIVFYDENGNEIGGIASSEAKPGKLTSLVFDFSNADAIGLMRRISADGKDISAGLEINHIPSS